MESSDLTEISRTFEAAISIRNRAYAPYSRYAVGAAVLGADGQIYSGCNVENASYGLTICAERSAVFAMVASGCQKILAAAIALSDYGSPCGACRQVLAEFGRDFPVYLVDSSTGQLRQQWSIQDLLPAAFSADVLPPQ